MSSDISQAVLSKACQVLNAGCTFVTDTEFLNLTWPYFALGALSPFALLAIVAVVVHFLMPNKAKASRTATLWGLAGMFVSSIFLCVFSLTLTYAVAKKDDDLMIAVILPAPLLMILTVVSFCIRFFSAIQVSGTYVYLYQILLFVISIIILHFFPIFSECTLMTLLITMLDVVIVSGFIPMAIDNFYGFMAVLYAEKIYIVKNSKDVGYLVKKESEWVEFYYEEDEETDSDKQKLIFNV